MCITISLEISRFSCNVHSSCYYYYGWYYHHHHHGLLVKILFQVECVFWSCECTKQRIGNQRELLKLRTPCMCTCTYPVVELQDKKSSYFSYPNLHWSFLTALECLFKSIWLCIVIHQLPWCLSEFWNNAKIAVFIWSLCFQVIIPFGDIDEVCRSFHATDDLALWMLWLLLFEWLMYIIELNLTRLLFAF